MEVNYCDLRKKEVVDIDTGKALGKIIDLVFEYPSNKVLGLVLPDKRLNPFKQKEDKFIPMKNIDKIGEDVILVDFNEKEKKPICFPFDKGE